MGKYRNVEPELPDSLGRVFVQSDRFVNKVEICQGRLSKKPGKNDFALCHYQIELLGFFGQCQKFTKIFGLDAGCLSESWDVTPCCDYLLRVAILVENSCAGVS